MTGTGVLLAGALVLALVLVLTLAIIAAAPYLAIIIVLGLMYWWYTSGEPDESQETTVTKVDLQE